MLKATLLQGKEKGQRCVRRREVELLPPAFPICFFISFLQATLSILAFLLALIIAH